MRQGNSNHEDALLGSILLSTDAQDYCIARLSEDHFTTEVRRKVFRAISTLYDQHVPIDQVTTRRESKLTVADIMDITAQCPVPASYRTYLKMVVEDRANREAKERTWAALQAFDAGERATGMALVEEASLSRVPGEDEDRVHDADGLFAQVLDVAEAAHRGATEVLGIPTGWASLDRVIGGLVPGNLVLVAGRPGKGKSALAGNLMLNLAKRGFAVLFMSLEMTAQEVGLRMLCQEAQVSWNRIRNRSTTDAEWQAIVAASERLARLPMTIVDHADVTSAYLRATVREHRPQVVIVDYIQLMASPGKETRQQEVSAISRNLKLLAKEQGVALVALAQLNRNIEMRGGDGASPLLSDLRDSGSLEQDADIVMFVNPKTGREMELVVAKNRNGQATQPGEVVLNWDRALVRITDPVPVAPHETALRVVPPVDERAQESPQG